MNKTIIISIIAFISTWVISSFFSAGSPENGIIGALICLTTAIVGCTAAIIECIKKYK